MTSQMVQRRERSHARRTLAFCFVAMVLAAGFAWWLVNLAEDESPAPTHTAHPELLVLTDRADVDVSYTVVYHRGAFTGPAGTNYTEGNQFQPGGAQTVNLDFRSKSADQTLHWALLEDSDAALTSPRSVRRLGDIARTAPGSEINSPCDQAENFDTAQVLSGQLITDNGGFGTVSIVGGVPADVRYPQVGERRAVNVIYVEAPAADDDATGSGGCHINLINWEQVGGRDWQTPHVSGGSVAIGDVPEGQFVESANPALTDTRTLAWDLPGPASISYTLFNTSVQSRHEIYVFLAGVLAALAATLLVEVVKAVPEAFQSLDAPPDGSSHPVVPGEALSNNDAEADPSGRNGQLAEPRVSRISAPRAFVLGAAAGWVANRFAERRPR